MAQITIATQTYQLDAILFDKDGTLLNLDHLWTGWLAAVLDCLAADLAPQIELARGAVQTALGVTLAERGADRARIDPRGPLAIGAMEDVMSILAQVLYQQHGVGWNDGVRLVQGGRSKAEAALDWHALVTPIAGVQALVTAARAAGVPMGVVTSDGHDSAVHHLNCLGLGDAMAVVVGHDDVVQGKPFPDMVRCACTTLGVAPERTLLFGDSNGDMQMAGAAAMVAGIGLAPPGASDHLSAADQVIVDYTGCTVTTTG